jgi:hypothetical protein
MTNQIFNSASAAQEWADALGVKAGAAGPLRSLTLEIEKLWPRLDANARKVWRALEVLKLTQPGPHYVNADALEKVREALARAARTEWGAAFSKSPAAESATILHFISNSIVRSN